jgi:LPS export ABC transporter protein LptC
MSRLPLKFLPVIGIVILFATIGFFLIKADYKGLEKAVLKNIGSEEGFELKNIHYIQNNPDENVKWVLDADKVTFTKNRQRISFDQFKFKLELENNSTIELHGKRGDYDKNSNEIDLRGDLNGYTSNGYGLHTDHILYKQEEGSLENDEPVKITGPFFSVEGKGLRYNLKKETLRIDSDVTTFINRRSLIL